MNENRNGPNLPERRRPAHHTPIDQGNRAIIIFLTVCTKDRRPVLTNDSMHANLRAAWIAADHWLVGRYMIMPDHIHLFCAPGSIKAHPLRNWMRFWKTAVSKVSGASEGTLWQVDGWDTQLRQSDSYAAKWEYVRNNPGRAGLVTRPQDWPFQGELNLLHWHD
jgi:putative transposase